MLMCANAVRAKALRAAVRVRVGPDDWNREDSKTTSLWNQRDY